MVLATIAADHVLLEKLEQSYAHTEQIIAGIAGNGDSGDGLLQFLKETPNEAWMVKGQQHMAAHGYDMQTQTIWDKKYRSAKKQILAVSAALDALLLLALFFLYILFQKQDKDRIFTLENILCQLQSPDALEPDFSSFGIEDVLTDRLHSLWEQIQTDHKRMFQEKEDTKSLVTDISHQLKTPVAALKTSLELLATEEMTEAEHQEFLENCLGQIDGLENLTKTLVDISRMEKGLIQIQTQPAAIQTTILFAVSRLYEKAAEKHITIEMQKNNCSETVLVMHDPKWTAEVFVNLLDNAIKYSHEHTTITVNAEELPTYFRVSVEDNGIGIPKAERHKIFKRFYRGEAVAHLEGSGVGLYLAREIIERQNGSIFVRSKSGRQTGSIFSVQLPKA